MRISSRRILTIGIVVLLVALVVEVGVLLGTAFMVPDLTERIQRIGSTPQAVAPPAQQAPTTLNNARPLTINDAFDSPSPRWDQSAVSIQNEALTTELFMSNAEVYTLWKGVPDNDTFDSRVQDFVLSVEMTQHAGNDDAYYGIRFRQNTTDSYMMVAINPRGYYRIFRSTFGEISDIVPWTFTHHLRPGLNTTNQLLVHADNTLVHVFINGIHVNEVDDLSPVRGQLTLSAFTTTSDYAKVSYDNVTIESGEVSFREAFANPDNVSFSLGGSYTSDGRYHIVSSPNVTVWQNPLPRADTAVQSFRLRVDSTIVRGDPNQIAYGVIFGDNGDFGYTMVLLSGSGVLSVVRNNSDGTSQQFIDPMLVDAVVPGLDQSTSIDLTLVNNELSLSINDVDLGMLQLDVPTSGSVGMIVVCGDTNVQVDFDNFSLTELSANE
ncbi:MAG: hypothetical protein RL076_2462 [Chloroflexota bacterium]|jgi:hypothetical protein